MRKIVRRSALVTLVTIVGLSTIATPARAEVVAPTLVRLTQTSQFSPPSPDPMGIAYRASTNTLMISDSEVEETVSGITLWQGVNVWETSLSGAVRSTQTTSPVFSNEPTDVAVNPSNGHVFFSDDDADKIFEVTLGASGRVGNSDETLTSFSTRTFPLAVDAEGLAYGAGSLFIADGAGSEIWRVQPGPNGRFDGPPAGGDDVVSHFDTAAFGQTDPEAVEYNPDAGTLYVGSRKVKTVAEVTLSGSVVRTYDLSGASTFRSSSGIAYAPTSNDPSSRSLYIVDRGVDNNTTATENDGQLFEFRVGSGPPPTNHAPVVTNPGNQNSNEGQSVNLPIQAADQDVGDTLTYSASGLPPGLSINSSSGVISGTVSGAAATGSPYSSSVTASDGSLSDTKTFSWTVSDTTAPVVTNPGSRSNNEGDSVTLPIVATDTDGDPLSYSASHLPPGLSINGSTGVISGTVSAGAAGGSPYASTVTASDGSSSDTKSFTWTIGVAPPTNNPPVVTKPVDQTSNEGQPATLQIQAADPDVGDTLTYSATGLPPGLSIDPSSGLISGTVAAGAAANSPYSSSVTATDQGSLSDTKSFTWTINDATAPAQPTGLVIDAQTTGLSLDWANNAEPDLAGYNVYRSSSANGPFGNPLNSSLLISSAYFDGGAPANQISYYRVTAVDKSGNESTPATASQHRSSITLVGVSSAKGKTTTLTISKPTGTQVGDTLLASIAVRGAATTVTAPSGWAMIRQDASAAAMNQVLFSHIAAGTGEPSSYAFTFSSSQGAAGVIAAYSGVAVGGVGTPGGQSSGSSPSNSITAPALSASVDSVEVGFFGIAAAASITEPSGMVERGEVSRSAGSASTRVTLELSDDVVGSDPLGVRVATASKSAENVGQAVILIP